MYKEFNSDAELCIVTPEEHEAFDDVPRSSAVMEELRKVWPTKK